MKGLLIFILGFSSLIFWSSCQHKPCNDPDTVYYETTIAPILNSSCGSSDINCHSTANDDNDEIDLSSYWAIMNSDEGDLVKPGKSNKSEMIEVIEDNEMPPDTSSYSISSANLELLKKWIDGGARESPCVGG